MRDAIAMPPLPSPSRAKRVDHPFAWQGWQLRVPASWNPVKLEGDFIRGYALLADLDGPRLGLRWSGLAAKEFNPEVLRRVIRDEAGDDAAQRAKPLPDPDQPDDGADGLVHLDPHSPGRDVHVWWSGSERLLEVVYHATHRDDVLVGDLIPSLSDASFLSNRPWAALDLCCRIPKEFTLTSRRLNAGDLAMEFGHGNRFVTVRQIALAAIALRRTPLAKWLANVQHARRLRYRSVGASEPITLDGACGLLGRMRRRRRFFWNGGIAGQCVALALHDAPRDRIVLVEASDEQLARDVAQTVGRDFN